MIFECKIRNEIVDINECSLCYPKRSDKIKEGKIQVVDNLFLNLSRAACKKENKVTLPIEQIPNAVTIEKAIAGNLYRTFSRRLVRVLREEGIQGPQVYLVFEKDGSRIKVSTDYILFSDIQELLLQKEVIETIKTTIKEAKKSNEEVKQEKIVLREEKRKRDLQRKAECSQVRLERKNKGTKTSHIDNLLKEGKEIEEIVKLIVKEFPIESEAKVKRLVWSRRAVYKKSIKDGQHEQFSTTKDSTNPTITG